MIQPPLSLIPIDLESFKYTRTSLPPVCTTLIPVNKSVILFPIKPIQNFELPSRLVPYFFHDSTFPLWVWGEAQEAGEGGGSVEQGNVPFERVALPDAGARNQPGNGHIFGGICPVRAIMPAVVTL